MFAYRPARAYPLFSSWFRCLIFLLIQVIYWHFLDAILGHTPSSFWVVCSPSSSAALQHRVRIPYIFDGSSALCPDPLYFQWLSGIVFRSPIFFTILWSESPIIPMAPQHRVQIPFLFDGSPTLCSDPLSFRQLSGIMSGSPIFFGYSRGSCPDPLSFRRLSGIVYGFPIFSVAL